MRNLLPIESTYLACLVNTYAVRGRTKVLRGGSRPAARLRGRAAAQLRGNIAYGTSYMQDTVRLYCVKEGLGKKEVSMKELYDEQRPEKLGRLQIA